MVDETGQVAGVDDIYAVGDMTGRRVLAARAGRRGRRCDRSKLGLSSLSCPIPTMPHARSTSSSPMTTRSSGPACGCCCRARRACTSIGEAGNVPDALRLVELRHPHVLVLDLNMPGPSSLTAIAEVKDTCAVVILTMQSDPAFAREALQAGARAYVLKEAAGAELVTAVRTAARGGIYLNPQLGARIAVEPRSRRGATTSASASSTSCA